MPLRPAFPCSTGGVPLLETGRSRAVRHHQIRLAYCTACLLGPERDEHVRKAASLVTLRVPAGLVGDRYSHPHEQFVQVLSGSGSLLTEQGERTFGPGSVFHFPAGTWHAAQFDTETMLVETNFRAYRAGLGALG